MIYRFGRFVLDTDRLELRNGEHIFDVEPQVFSLLAFLIRNRDRVVGKDELFDAIWQGRIVSEATLNSRINAVRRAVGDSGKTQTVVRTFPRRGFRFVADVVSEPAPDDAPAIAVDETSDPQSDRPAVAVLPFRNIGNNADDECFAGGLSEDIITSLAMLRSFPVISRNSSFSFKGTSPDVREVATALRARYVLEGSIRKAGDRIRITAQLVDGGTGNDLWADRYDRVLEDVFAVQDEITANIVTAIEPQVSWAELLAIKQKRPDNLTSWELYLRGIAAMAYYGRQPTETKRYFERAIEADPAFPDAYLGLAQCHSADIYAMRADDVNGAIATMAELADKAAAIDPQLFRVYHVRCMMHIWAGALPLAVEAGRKAVQLNPSSPESCQFLALALTHWGAPEEGEKYARACFKLSPIDPKLHAYHFQLMQSLLGQRRFEEAYDSLDKCLYARPHDIAYLGFKTVLLGHMGRTEEASACLTEYLSKRGLQTADDYRRVFIPNSVQTELNLEGLRKAGWDV